jgi:hypothetical protein
MNTNQTWSGKKSFLFVASLATFFIYDAYALAAANNQGLNEYIDPSQNPKYSQLYNEITFTGDGITKEELDDIKKLINLKENSIEEPMAIVGEEIIPIQQLKAGSKIRSISFNSTPEDTKILELNYYRGKDENLENKKATLKELKDKKSKELEQNITRLENEIDSQEISIQKNKTNWDKKAKSNKAQVEKLKSKTQTAISNNNKEIMDILYPSKENIDQLNAEILEERNKSKNFLEQNANQPKSIKEKLQAWITIPKVMAWGDSSNSVNNLVIYNRSNWDYIWDVDYANAVNGQTFKLWGRANDAPKQFRFIDARAEIRFVGKAGVEKCVDVDLANGRYDNGDRVHLWDCHGGNNQKFIVQSDGTIRPKSAQHMCLDASAGVSYGSRIHLWQCHGGSNQKFNAGEYDFDGQRFYLRIYSKDTGSIIGNGLIGHSLVSVWRTGRGTTNAFSFWPNKDTYGINDWGRSNNIRTENNINVDEGKNGADWNIAYHGNISGYKIKDIQVTKQIYDEIKYMKGYTLQSWSSDFVTKDYNVCNRNCSTYSASLFAFYTGQYFNPLWNGSCHAPGGIYKAL